MIPEPTVSAVPDAKPRDRVDTVHELPHSKTFPEKDTTEPAPLAVRLVLVASVTSRKANRAPISDEPPATVTAMLFAVPAETWKSVADCALILDADDMSTVIASATAVAKNKLPAFNDVIIEAPLSVTNADTKFEAWKAWFAEEDP